PGDPVIGAVAPHVVIAPYEGSQPAPVRWLRHLGPRRHRSLRGIATTWSGCPLCPCPRRSSSLPTRDRNIHPSASNTSSAVVVIAPYEGSQRRHVCRPADGTGRH